MTKAISITPQEAMLIDFVTTMHSYDVSLLEQLKTIMATGLRKKIAPLIVEEKEQTISFTVEELEYLLLVVPITFRFYKDDIGFSLKKKLLATLFTPKVNWDLEVKNVDNNNHTDENDSQSSSSNSPGTC